MAKQMSQQQQMMVAVVLAVVGGMYIYWNYLLSPTMKKIEEHKTELAGLNEKIEKAERQARRLPILQAELAQLQTDLSAMETQLPKDKDVPNILRTLTREAQTEDLRFTRLTPKPAMKQTYFEIIPFEVSFTGSMHSLAKFLTSLGQQDRIFQAQNISLTPGGGDSSTGVATLGITLTIQTYAYAG